MTSARSTTSRCWSATAPPRSTRIWRWRPWRAWSAPVPITDITPEQAVRNLVKALGKGVLKVMSKMGISTVASYRGAQVFEALGLSQELVDRYFTGTTSKLGGIGLDVIHEEVQRRHDVAYPLTGISPAHRQLEVGGEYQWRREGEPHLFDPETVFRLQHATREGRYDVFREYTDRVDDQSKHLMTLRGIVRPEGRATPVGAARRGRAGQRDRQAVLHRGDVLRVDLAGGPRDSGDRDEPTRRRSPTRGRAARIRSASCRWPTATRSARRSSRSPRVASVSPASTWSTPTTSRSRWPRGPSPARADSCPGTRCTRGWPRPVTRRRAWG